MALSVSLLSVRQAGGHRAVWDAPVADYLRRCGRILPASSRTLRSEVDLLEMVREERREGAARFWIADLGGKVLTTEQFTERLRELREGGVRHLLLAVGPANGWSAEARSLADLRLSLSAMTLPHELAWLLLAEQVYRASTILQGHPYHLGH